MRENPPIELTCPISLEVMIEPVTASDGHSYDRSSYEKLPINSNGKRISPITQEELDDSKLVDSFALRKLIDPYLTQQQIDARIKLNRERQQNILSELKVEFPTEFEELTRYTKLTVSEIVKKLGLDNVKCILSKFQHFRDISALPEFDYEELFKLSDWGIYQLVRHPEKFFQLVTIGKISPRAIFKFLNSGQKLIPKKYKYVDDIFIVTRRIINLMQAGITWEQLITLDAFIRGALLKNSSTVHEYLVDAKLPKEKFLQLDEARMIVFLEKSTAFINLVRDTNATWDDLLSLDIDRLAAVEKYDFQIKKYFSTLNIHPQFIFTLPIDEIEYLAKNWICFTEIATHFGILLSDLLLLNKEDCNYLIENWANRQLLGIFAPEMTKPAYQSHEPSLSKSRLNTVLSLFKLLNQREVILQAGKKEDDIPSYFKAIVFLHDISLFKPEVVPAILKLSASQIKEKFLPLLEQLHRCAVLQDDTLQALLNILENASNFDAVYAVLDSYKLHNVFEEKHFILLVCQMGNHSQLVADICDYLYTEGIFNEKNIGSLKHLIEQGVLDDPKLSDAVARKYHCLVFIVIVDILSNHELLTDKIKKLLSDNISFHYFNAVCSVIREAIEDDDHNFRTLPMIELIIKMGDCVYKFESHCMRYKMRYRSEKTSEELVQPFVDIIELLEQKGRVLEAIDRYNLFNKFSMLMLENNAVGEPLKRLLLNLEPELQEYQVVEQVFTWKNQFPSIFLIAEMMIELKIFNQDLFSLLVGLQKQDDEHQKNVYLSIVTLNENGLCTASNSEVILTSQHPHDLCVFLLKIKERQVHSNSLLTGEMISQAERFLQETQDEDSVAWLLDLASEPELLDEVRESIIRLKKDTLWNSLYKPEDKPKITLLLVKLVNDINSLFDSIIEGMNEEKKYAQNKLFFGLMRLFSIDGGLKFEDAILCAFFDFFIIKYILSPLALSIREVDLKHGDLVNPLYHPIRQTLLEEHLDLSTLEGNIDITIKEKLDSISNLISDVKLKNHSGLIFLKGLLEALSVIPIVFPYISRKIQNYLDKKQAPFNNMQGQIDHFKNSLPTLKTISIFKVNSTKPIINPADENADLNNSDKNNENNEVRNDEIVKNLLSLVSVEDDAIDPNYSQSRLFRKQGRDKVLMPSKQTSSDCMLCNMQ